MDNEKLEIVDMEPKATSGRYPWNADVDTKAITSQALPIAGGVVAGVIGGYLLCRFVVKPLITKFKEKKTSTPTETVTEPVKEEE